MLLATHEKLKVKVQKGSESQRERRATEPEKNLSNSLELNEGGKCITDSSTFVNSICFIKFV